MSKHKPVRFDTKAGGNYDLMAAALAESESHLKSGNIVKGTVVAIRGNEVLIDIGYKAEGSVSISEFKDAPDLKVGDTFDVIIIRMERDDGMIELSKSRADEKLRWEAILEKYTEGCVVTGLVKGRVRGGLMVDVDGIESFLPGSQISLDPGKDQDALVGQELEFKLIKIGHDRHNLVLSRRELIEERLVDQKRDLLASIQIGQVRKGVVKNLTDFGAFIDLSGLDGLLHITDMSWGRVKHPSEIVHMGQELDVVVLDIDLRRERVSLGLKQTQPNPWDAIEERYPAGARVRGKVVNLAAYGAFVELEPGVEGLVHISEFSWTKHYTRASDMLAEGDEVEVVILSIDHSEQKIALGIRQTMENPWDTITVRHPVGSRVTGKVRNFTQYGAFIEIEDGIDGMVHTSDMSWTRKINHPNEILKKGEEIEAVVLEIDPPNQRISLGLKQISEDPWNTVQTKFPIGSVVKGKVARIASFGAFIELEDGIDGLVRTSQISEEHVERVKDVLKIGQEISARVISIDVDDRRIALSIKAVDMTEEDLANLTKEANAKTGLKPGENLVGLAAAFDNAFAQSEEWQPGAKNN